MFNAVFEHDLKANTDSHYRLASDKTLIDKFATIDCIELIHHRGEGSNARHDQTIGVQNRIAIASQLNLGPGNL